METTVIERISRIKKNEGLTNEKFSNQSNIPLETIKSMFSKKTNPNLDTIQKIYSAFPHYSLEWIICGIGDMYKKEDGSQLVENIAGKNLSIIDLRREYLDLIKYRNFYNFLTKEGNTYSTTVIASELNMTAKKLNEKLEELEVIRKQDDRWILCDKYLGNDYQKAHQYIKNGEWNNVTDYMVWTANGRLFLHSILNEKFNDDMLKPGIVEVPEVKSVDTNFLLDRIEKLAVRNNELEKELEQLKNASKRIVNSKPYPESDKQLMVAEKTK